MGKIVKFTCKKCGHVVDELFLGPGFISNQVAFECLDCHGIMSKEADDNGHLTDDQKTCSHCNGANLVPWDGKCPNCGNKMKGECIGLWD